MRSIPIAMMWELWQRGRWPMLLGILGANAMPVFLFTALRMEPGFDSADPSFVSMQLMMLPLVIFCFAAAILAPQEFSARDYTLPASNVTLVAGRMVPAMVMVSLLTVVNIACLNAAFGLHWPLWGPALVAPVALAMIQAALWYSAKSSLLPMNVGIAAGIIGLWYKSRFGAVFSTPSHVWETVSPMEVATLLSFAVASYFVAVAGVARNRCGESLGTRGMFVRLENVLKLRIESFGDLVPWRSWSVDGGRFRSPTDAQFRSEWHRKGWLLSGVVVFGGSFMLSIWLVFNRNPVELVEGMISGGAIVSLLGIVGGLAVGNCGTGDSNFEMGHFLATRPLTNRQLAGTSLKVAAWTVLISWAIWAVPSVFIAGLLAATGNFPQSLMISQLSWWYLPATLLGCWITVSMTASCLLTGRVWLLAMVYGLFMAAAITFILMTKSLDRETRAVLYSLMLMVCGGGFGLLTLWAMIVARRRSLIATRTIAASGCVWFGICVVIAGELLRNSSATFLSAATVSIVVFLAGVASLSVAPFALAPLAVTSNRHR